MENPNIKVVESYLYAIRDKDLSKAPVASDVTHEDPLAPRSSGAEAWQAYLSNLLPAVNDVQIKRHIADGEYVATFWEADTVWGLIPVFEYFHVVDGQIKDIRAFFDPRPITNPAQ
jgi:limonene-1,2-epoxide hydrolase